MEKRIYFLDILRFLAICTVVLTHVSSPYVFTYDKSSISFYIGGIVDSISRIGVPIFMMISGALMLDQNRNVKFKNKIISLIIIFFIWSFIYACIFYIIVPIFNGDDINLKAFTSQIIRGHYHLWYLWAIIGVYLITPVLRCFVKKDNTKIVLYCIILSVIFLFTKPVIDLLFSEVSVLKNVDGIYGCYLYIYNIVNSNFLGIYITYYLTGWYILNGSFVKKQKIIIYVLGYISLMLLCLSIFFFPHQYDLVYSNGSILIYLFSITIFIQIFDAVKKYEIFTPTILTNLNKLSFGVYLIHIIILRFLEIFIPQKIILMPLMWLLCICISFGLTFIISKIPFVKRIIKI